MQLNLTNPMQCNSRDATQQTQFMRRTQPHLKNVMNRTQQTQCNATPRTQCTQQMRRDASQQMQQKNASYCNATQFC